MTTVPVQKLEKEAFPRKGRPSSANLLLVLLHDLLFSPKGKIECSDKVDAKAAVLRHQTRLKAELVRLQIKAGKKSIRELGKEGLSSSVRYIRYNPRRADGDAWTLDALHNHLQGEVGLNLLPEPVYPVPSGAYFMDPHLPEYLLVFESGANWWLNSEWYERGSIVLQDKASCMPAAVIMADRPSASGDEWEQYPDCIDGTAAPGNKTSLMSALAPPAATVYAFEKSPQRFHTLEKMLARAGCANVVAYNGDFTALDPAEYPTVGRILLDPSCSGSGIVNRLDYLVDAEEEAEADTARLDKLAAFQFQMIQHALKCKSPSQPSQSLAVKLTAVPNVSRIVYSTCSIHAVEDENVVARVLAYSRAHPIKIGGVPHAWVLEPRDNVLPAWPRRGMAGELCAADADKVIRCAPEDHTNGFFVACFRRVPLAEAEAQAEAQAAALAEMEAEQGAKVAQDVKKGAVKQLKKGRDSKAEKVAQDVQKGATKQVKKGRDSKAESSKGVEKAPKKDSKALPKGGMAAAKTKREAEVASAPEPAPEKPEPSKKRPAEDAPEPVPKKAKTDAQLERARRKKKAQKAKAAK